MHRIHALNVPALLFILSAITVCSHGADPAGEIPKPVDLGTSDVSAYVVIPQPETLIKNVEEIVRKFNPQPMPPEMIKTQIGAMVGDAGLAGLDTSKPIVVLLFKEAPAATPPATPPFAIYIPVTNAEPYKNALKAIGKLNVEVKDNIVIASDRIERLDKGVAMLPVYNKIAAGAIKADIRAFASITQLVETYGKQIDAGMETWSKTMAQLPINPAGGPAMDPKMLGVIVKLYAKALSAMLKQSDLVQYDLSYKEGALKQEVLYTAKPETALAKMLVEPAPGENKLLPLMRNGGVMGASYRINSEAMKNLMNMMLPEIEKDPDLKEIADAKMIALFKDAVGLFSGDMAMTMLPVEKGGFPAMRMAMAVSDEKKYLDMLERSMALMLGADSFLGKTYAQMGISMKFEKNIREHAGVSVQRLKTTIDAEKMAPMQVAQMKSMMRDTEFAVTKGMYLAATDPAELNQMIDQLQSGQPPKDGPVQLKAMKTFGPKQHFYMDYDLIGLMKAMTSADPNNPIGPAFKDVKSGEPMHGAAVYSSGRVYTQINMPLQPYVDMAKAMQNLGAGPGAAPPRPPEPVPGQF